MELPYSLLSGAIDARRAIPTIKGLMKKRAQVVPIIVVPGSLYEVQYLGTPPNLFFSDPEFGGRCLGWS
jgi:hypothetical protein